MSINLQRENCNHLLEWEKIEQDISGGHHTYRAKVEGGWFVRFVTTSSHPVDTDHIFLADKKHLWGSVADNEV